MEKAVSKYTPDAATIPHCARYEGNATSRTTRLHFNEQVQNEVERMRRKFEYMANGGPSMRERKVLGLHRSTHAHRASQSKQRLGDK